MSTTRALPILRTPDRQAAYDAARQLLDLTVQRDLTEASGFTNALTTTQARQMFEAFPHGWGEPTDLDHDLGGDSLRRLFDVGDPQLAELAPFNFRVEEEPVGSVEEQFLDLVGAAPAWLYWDGFGWPAVPELGLGPRLHDAMLELILNNRSLALDRPSDDHTLYVHFRQGDVERAEWLARQVGLAPIGPVELGW
ncbi:hypothetical protein [Kitasatospora sp. NPDC093102]|uniref:hypothetical protein n=1 Tax=Kitasatospora sp. NPDC093102 TaxID=3155069 RepID=UPI00342DFB3A